LADKYFCNFSLFQSLPDSWAIDQMFPIMPIQRLDEKPDREATLQDMTCDSDGKIANFVTSRPDATTLPLHSLRDKENYYGRLPRGSLSGNLGRYAQPLR
jgi:arginine decarboxylase